MVGAPEQPGAKRIPIDIVSDTVCPWCYIGKLRLEQAMKSFEGQGLEFEVRWHPYQLNPAAPQEGQNKLAMYRAKFGPQVDSMLPRMKDTFAEHGLTYSIGGLTGNTLNSHRLIHWAGLNYGSRAQNSLVEALFNDYFCQEKYINDRDVLLQAVEQVGLDRQAAAAVLDDPNMYRAEVESAINQARRQGISGVPNFTIDNKFQVSGAQSPQEFLRVFREVARNKGAATAKPVGAACTPGGECL